VVVYKVDRLSRSLLDFAQLLARFEEKNVGFVSTTQQFNTRDAMGRLTLNIVVSFAQFEREMIADRTRDKMGAARKRGKWLGSRPPLGYLGDRERMRLVVVPDEAEQVRTMFQLYLRLGSASEVARRINELGWQRKTTRTRAGREVGGGAWTEKDVHMLLRNPIYLGKVDFKGARYEGEHEAIVDAPLFEQVQRTLDAKACGRGTRRGRNPEYLLQSLLHCGLCGQPMTTTAGKGRSGEVYRYYACRNRARKTPSSPTGRCEHPRLSAPEVEELVISRVRHVCTDRAMREQIAARHSRDSSRRWRTSPRRLERAPRPVDALHVSWRAASRWV
jgi:site-specific DNA recombinase